MKNSNTLFLATAVMISSICIADQEKDSRVEELGHLFHFAVDYCRGALSHEALSDKSKMFEKLTNELTISQVLEAFDFELDGKNAFTRAKSEECEECQEYAQKLEESREEAVFIIEVLQAGHLTRKEVFQNPDFSAKINARINKNS